VNGPMDLGGVHGTINASDLERARLRRRRLRCCTKISAHQGGVAREIEVAVCVLVLFHYHPLGIEREDRCE